MKRMLCVAVASIALLSACSGGDKASSPEGQSDYLDRVAALHAVLARDTSAAGCAAVRTSSCDRAALDDAVQKFVEQWNKLRPPDDVAESHHNYGTSILNLSAFAAIPTAEVRDAIKRDPAILSNALLYQDTSKAWHAAVEAHFGVTLFSIEGSGMASNLCAGDTFFFKVFDGDPALTRWDIVAFKFPLDTTRDFIKRVVGLPGETIEVRDSHVYVNGALLEGDTYAKEPPNYTYAARTVPPDSFWVLGDNRRNSFDSHAWGTSCVTSQQCDFVPKSDVIGTLPPDTKGCRAKTDSS